MPQWRRGSSALLLASLFGAMCLGVVLAVRFAGGPSHDVVERSVADPFESSDTEPEPAPVVPDTARRSARRTPVSETAPHPEEHTQVPPLTLDVVVRQDVRGELMPAAAVQVRARLLSDPSSNRPDEEREEETSAGGTASLSFDMGGSVLVAAMSSSSYASAQLRFVAGGTHAVELLMAPALTVHGYVEDAVTGSPIEGAKVSFAEGLLPPSSTDSLGRFALGPLGLDSISVSIVASAEGYGAERAKFEVREDGSWSLPARFGHPALEGDPSTVPSIDLALVPEKAISGRVIDGKGAPIVGALVEATGFFSFMESTMMPDQASSQTDTRGLFHLPGLRSDITHAIGIGARGCRTTLVIDPGPGRRHVGDVVLGQASVLRGAVWDERGLPVPGVLVELNEYPPTERKPTELSLSPGKGLNEERDGWSFLPVFDWTTFTDGEGRFEFWGVPRAKVRLRVKPGDTRQFKNDLKVEDLQTEVEPFILGQNLPVLRGRVALAGEPVADAQVEISSLSGLHRGRSTTDWNGRFAVTGFHPQASYVARVYMASDDGRVLMLQERVNAQGRELQLDL